MTAQPIKQVWNWNDFSWWEWDWFYYWPKWWVRVTSKVALREVENWARIVNLKTDTWITYLWDVRSINPFRSRCFSTRDVNTWKIYDNWVFKFNMATWTTAYDTIVWWWQLNRASDKTTYSYWISATSYWTWQIQRFDTNFWWVSYWIWWNRTLADWATNNPSYERAPVLSLPTRIIWGWSNTIFQIDRNEVIKTLISFPIWAEIRAITYYQDTFKIYYNLKRYTNWPTDWIIAYWDWISNTIEQFVKYENSNIQCVVNDWAYDYVVFWDWITSDLYYVWWLNRWNPVRVNTEQNFNNNNRIFWTEWFIREWILYITWQDKFWNECIYSYWSYYPWTPRSLISENDISSYSGSLINASSNQFFDIYDEWKIYYQRYWVNEASSNQWILISYPIIWWLWIHTLKTIEKIDISYNLYSSSNYINVYVKKNWWPYSTNTTWWTLIKTITDNTKRWVKIYRNELISLWLWDFNELEFKIELNQPYNSYSPIFHQLRLEYLDNIK